MAQDFERGDTRIPEKILNTLRTDYFSSGEEIVDIIHESYAAAVDFRWVILTNKRVFIAIRHYFDAEFRVFPLEGLNYDYHRGLVLYDTIEFKSQGGSYRATLYVKDRAYTEKFIDQIKKIQAEAEEAKKKSNTDPKMQAVMALDSLNRLKKEGVIGLKEYEDTKREFLKKLHEAEK